MTVEELQNLLAQVALQPGGKQKQVVFMGFNGTLEVVEQIIPCDLTGVGGHLSTEITSSVMLHDYISVREDYLDELNSHILKPQREVYRSTRSGSFPQCGRLGPRGGTMKG